MANLFWPILIGSLFVSMAAGRADRPRATETDSHEFPMLQEVEAEVDLMLQLLNEALFALSGNDVRVAGSKFHQLLGRWRLTEARLHQLYPDVYPALVGELARAEGAFLQPTALEVNPAIRPALRALRAQLLEIASDLRTRLARPDPAIELVPGIPARDRWYTDE